MLIDQFTAFVESTLMFASHGDQIGLVKLVQGHRNSTADGNYIPTKGEGRKSIKLRLNEVVLQVIRTARAVRICRYARILVLLVLVLKGKQRRIFSFIIIIIFFFVVHVYTHTRHII